MSKSIEELFKFRRFGNMKLGLERIRALVKGLGNPQNSYKIIHVGGSNGKGSTVAMIASILKHAGYKVGKFTSPHLSSFSERICINEKQIPENDVDRLFRKLKNIAAHMKEKPTFFEFTTALALKWFEENEIDFAIIEVGIGGRLDATNIVQPCISVITNVTLEHTNILGNNLISIANEKAGIIKTGAPLITAVEEKEIINLFKRICSSRNTSLFLIKRNYKIKDRTLDRQVFETENQIYKLSLLGDHQVINALCAIKVSKILDLEYKYIYKGLKSVRLPGRFEVVHLNPFIILDCAKDPLGMKCLAASIKKYFPGQRPIFVLSISKDKAIELILKQITKIAEYVIATQHSVQKRAINANELKKKLNAYGIPSEAIPNVKDAVKRAMQIADKLVCITGSVFTVAEARSIFKLSYDARFARW